jgi:hypothetical protein
VSGEVGQTVRVHEAGPPSKAGVTEGLEMGGVEFRQFASLPVLPLQCGPLDMPAAGLHKPQEPSTAAGNVSNKSEPETVSVRAAPRGLRRGEAAYFFVTVMK